MKKERSAPPLPTPTVAGTAETPFGTVRFLRYGGKLGDSAPVAYSIRLPQGEGLGQWNDLFPKLAAAYLSYLEKESRRGTRPVWFGGLEGEVTPKGILLSAAFCPFEERAFRPVASLTFEENGRFSVHFIKKRG